jgi:hypothetical protein
MPLFEGLSVRFAVVRQRPSLIGPRAQDLAAQYYGRLSIGPALPASWTAAKFALGPGRVKTFFLPLDCTQPGAIRVDTTV